MSSSDAPENPLFWLIANPNSIYYRTYMNYNRFLSKGMKKSQICSTHAVPFFLAHPALHSHKQSFWISSSKNKWDKEVSSAGWNPQSGRRISDGFPVDDKWNTVLQALKVICTAEIRHPDCGFCALVNCGNDCIVWISLCIAWNASCRRKSGGREIDI